MVYVHFLLATLLLVFLFSLFIKNKKVLQLIAICLVLASFFIGYQIQYTTFEDLYSDLLNNDSEIERIRLTVYNPSDSLISDRIKDVTIRDEKIINRILDDFKSMELKKEEDPPTGTRKYDVRFVVTKEVETNLYRTEYISFNLNEDFLSNYEIISDTNHLETIKSLEENDEVDWKDYGEN